MKTTEQIEITPAPADLLKYTHATLDRHTAESLAASIADLEAQGFRVLYATGARSAVPTSYRSAYKMRAPHWYFDGEKVRATDAKLENRPHGCAIPANFTVMGDMVPDGFRCFKREADAVVIRHR